MTIQEEMGKIIKDLRTELKLSQTDLALKVGYTDKSAIAKIEAGKVDLPQSKIVAFAKVLGVTPCYLFGEANNNILSLKQQLKAANTIAAHFEGDNFTEEQLGQIEAFAKFIKQES